MADMYSLPSYMNGPTNLRSVDGIYALPNYHAIKKPTDNSETGGFTVVDPAKCLDLKQKGLINNLTELGNKLNAILKSKGQEMNKKTDSSFDGKKKILSTNEAENIPNKTEKSTRKEMRKNAKQDAKSKVASQPQEVHLNATKSSEWAVKIGNSLTRDQSLDPCNKPQLAKYTIQDLGNIEMTITNHDVSWVAALSLIGSRRGVAFPGKVGNNTSTAEARSSVTVKIGDSFIIAINGVCLKSRITAWKLLGCSLGLFSFDPLFSLQAAHQHHWLEKAECVLENHFDISFAQREMSQYLSRFDTLGSYFDIGIADIIFRSLLQNDSNYANNIELWAHRVDTAV